MITEELGQEKHEGSSYELLAVIFLQSVNNIISQIAGKGHIM